MIIIYDFNQTLESYVEQGIHNCFPEMEECPQCRAKTRLKRHGFYHRHAVEEGATYRISICRFKCPSCGKTLSLLPDFLLPYFQHTLHTVISRIEEKLINKKNQGVRQLIQFYYKRFINQITNIEMFFRDRGWRGESPPYIKEKAIRLLEMICALGKATFVRKSRGHFRNNFMAR
jgi:transposase-like protein